MISWGYGNNDIPDTVKGWRPSGLQQLVSMFILTSAVSEFSDILLVPKCLTLVWRRTLRDKSVFRKNTTQWWALELGSRDEKSCMLTIMPLHLQLMWLAFNVGGGGGYMSRKHKVWSLELGEQYNHTHHACLPYFLEKPRGCLSKNCGWKERCWLKGGHLTEGGAC